jgi:hypothetical protein
MGARVLLSCLLALAWTRLLGAKGIWTTTGASAWRVHEQQKDETVRPLGQTGRLSRLFNLRGGDSSPKKDGEKIKGVCIGIDLGTTYR